MASYLDELRALSDFGLSRTPQSWGYAKERTNK